MPLTPKRKMTEKNLKAHRLNGPQSTGPATPAGKARAAAANLRHGFYSKSPNPVLTALGEDPQQYADLMSSLENNLAEGLEGALKRRIGRTLWKMERADNVQDSIAAQRIQAAQDMQEFQGDCEREKLHEYLDRYDRLDTALSRRAGPTGAEIEAFVESFGDDPEPEMLEFFTLLGSLERPERETGPGEAPGAGDRQADREWKAARRRTRIQLRAMTERSQLACQQIAEKLERRESAQNLAATVAPHDAKALLALRVEDSALRQLWRLTNMLFRVQNRAQTEKDVKNEKWSG